MLVSDEGYNCVKHFKISKNFSYNLQIHLKISEIILIFQLYPLTRNQEHHSIFGSEEIQAMLVVIKCLCQDTLRTISQRWKK